MCVVYYGPGMPPSVKHAAAAGTVAGFAEALACKHTYKQTTKLAYVRNKQLNLHTYVRTYSNNYISRITLKQRKTL